MGRKHLLAGLLENDELTAVNSTPMYATDANVPTGTQPTHGKRGAVGAMSRSLERMTAELDAARSLEARLTAGVTVVEIDPSLIDPSPIPDRFASSTQGHLELVAAIRERGQQVPILVRPHPEKAERYQVAFGHRRLRAVAELGRPVRAIIKPLTDDELVVAQGHENNARQDLSFIERANFAAALEDRGYSRDIIMAALLVDKTELSRLISVRRSIPDPVIAAIGPAPKAGRRRWMALAGFLAQAGAALIVQRILAETAFSSASSDERLQRLLAAFTPMSTGAPGPIIVRTADGTKVAHVERGANGLTLNIDDRSTPAFGDFLIERLVNLYEEFRCQRETKE
jgi:ParB family chromosome partitioning protein